MKTTSLLPAFQSNIAKSLVLSFIVTLPLQGQVKDQYLHVLSRWDQEFVEEQMPVILDSDKRDIQPPNNLVLEWGNISLPRFDSLKTILNIGSELYLGDGKSLNDLNLEFCVIKKPRNSGSTDRSNSISETLEAKGNIDFDVIGVYYRFNGTKWNYLPVGTEIPAFPLYFNQVGYEDPECDQPELYITDGYGGNYRDRNFENLYVFNLLYTRGYLGFRDQSEYSLGLYERIISKHRDDQTYDYSLEFNQEIVKELSSSKFLDLVWQCFNSYNSTIEQLFDNPISIEWDWEFRNSYYSHKKNKNVVNISQYTPYWKDCESPPFIALPIIGKSDSLVYGHFVVLQKDVDYYRTASGHWNSVRSGPAFHTIVLNPYSHSYMDFPLQASPDKKINSYTDYTPLDIRDGFFRYFFFQDVLYPSLNSTDKITEERKHFDNSQNFNEQLDTLWSNFTSELKEIASRGLEKTRQNVMYGLTFGEDNYNRIHYTKDFKQIRYNTTKHYPENFGILYDAREKSLWKRYDVPGYTGHDLTCDSLIQRTDKWVSEAINLISEFYGPVIPIRTKLETINDALPYLTNEYELRTELTYYKNFKGRTIEEVMDEVVDRIPELDSLRNQIIKVHTGIEKVAQRLFRLRFYSGKEINEAFNQWVLYYDGLTLREKRRVRNQFSMYELMSYELDESKWLFDQHMSFGDLSVKYGFQSPPHDCYILFLSNGEVLLRYEGTRRETLSYKDDRYYGTFPRFLDLSNFFPYLE